MFTKDINNFLRTSKRVRSISFVENIYNDETKEWTEKVHLFMDTVLSNIYAGQGSGGNCILYSTDRVLIEQLYYLCRLFNYDVHHDEYGLYGTLMLIGCDGSCKAMGGVSLFARVNGGKPDELFNK